MLLNQEDIKRLLPHREPMLLVDGVVEITEEYVVGEKTFHADEYFFTGHFPNEPVVPGVLLVEAMAQTGGIKIIYDQQKASPIERHYSTYFLGIDKVKFRRKVLPDELITMKIKQLTPIRHSIVTMQGECYVGDTLAAEALMTAKIITTLP